MPGKGHTGVYPVCLRVKGVYFFLFSMISCATFGGTSS